VYVRGEAVLRVYRVCQEIHTQITIGDTVYVRGEAVLRVYRVCQEIHTQITTLVTQCTYAEKQCCVCIVYVRKFILYSPQNS